MRERKNAIAFVGCFTRKGNMFNDRHQSNIRSKFLEARLRCVEKYLSSVESFEHNERKNGNKLKMKLM